MRRARARSMFVLGMMSGTSADGIDVALVRLRGRPPKLSARLVKWHTFPYPRTVRAEILRIAGGAETSAGQIGQLNFLLGELFADAALRACRRFRVSPKRIALIGSHGQTIYHQAALAKFLEGPRVASTLQIGEAAVIAARTGIPTVADFRPADIAAGGQGAPLVPFVDYLLYRDSHRGRVALNIGGIANVTVIPPAARPGRVRAFDTGPGNMLVDVLVAHFSRGRRSLDRGAAMARRGNLLPGLLADLLSDPYFRQAPPKSAGREQFGPACLARVLAWGRRNAARPEDLVRTATLFTVLAVVDAYHHWIVPRMRQRRGARARSVPEVDLIVSGGGARNPLMMSQLKAALPGVTLRFSGEFGVPEDAKEAFAFAVLAYETFHGRAASLPSATGARRAAVLGKIAYPPKKI